MALKYDLRWPVVKDRYKCIPDRPVQELQQRFYDVANRLQVVLCVMTASVFRLASCRSPKWFGTMGHGMRHAWRMVCDAFFRRCLFWVHERPVHDAAWVCLRGAIYSCRRLVENRAQVRKSTINTVVVYCCIDRLQESRGGSRSPTQQQNDTSPTCVGRLVA